MDTSNRSRIPPLAWLNALGFLAVFAVNALSSTGAINGKTPGALSDGIFNLFVPAGPTFAIWGVIYLALIAFTVFQFQRPEEARRVGAPYLLSCAANVAWIFLWHYQFVGLSLVAMLVLLGSLLWLDRIQAAARTNAHASVRAAYWFSVVPFRIYLGWIAVATIANATAWLVTIGWNGFGLAASTWTVVVVVVAAVLALLRLLLERDAAFAGVVLWAFCGILLRHLTTLSSQYRDVVGATAVLSLLLLSGIAVTVAAGVRRGRSGGKPA
jgi:hypothetical protein